MRHKVRFHSVSAGLSRMPARKACILRISSVALHIPLRERNTGTNDTNLPEPGYQEESGIYHASHHRLPQADRCKVHL